jgi:hypothetical protein
MANGKDARSDEKPVGQYDPNRARRVMATATPEYFAGRIRRKLSDAGESAMAAGRSFRRSFSSDNPGVQSIARTLLGSGGRRR